MSADPTDLPPAPPAPAQGVPPPLDPELAEPLRRIRAEMAMPLTPRLIPDRRLRSRRARLPDEALERGGAFTVRERTAPGPDGAPAVPLLICTPTAAPRPFPVLYHVHGGGMVAGTHRGSELACDLDRAQELGAAVAAVDYRLAPEHPHPAPVEDCYAGLTWLARNAAALGIDPGRIVVGGNSAGGGLAAGLALLARDRDGPRPCGQFLQFPMLDDRCRSRSHTQMLDVGVWDGRSNLTGWRALLGGAQGGHGVSGYAAPARAHRVDGLPPAYIEVGSVEALRDEGIAYASRIWEAGGRAELHVWSGAFHSFDEWVPGAAVSRTAHTARVDWLRRTLAR
ncbi:alpha/beta hydrolase [Nocardiopsis baichengensis]|uniref:alpha/beta hydrolase n=1 Tax=Nocardiopsis baichengensis TaxID=280240 RepID=UPI0003457C2D|nr:alpha/beta hydrolase [Nocardiopsis baichengensis]